MRDDGYRGVWYSIAKGSNVAYSGGLGTYPPHVGPMAVHAPKANKTFFVYGGAGAGGKGLRIMASYYDHASGVLPRPTIVRDCGTFDDAHANPALCIDGEGYLWVFAARRHTFAGKLYRSDKPYDTSAFAEVRDIDAYPQPWWTREGGFTLVYTRYTGGRENYWQTSRDGTRWSDEGKLTTGGHYVKSYMQGRSLMVACDWHPTSSDDRTNLYFMRSDDFGKTWSAADGKALTPPLEFPENGALVREYKSQKKYVFINDVKADPSGKPLILYVVSQSGAYGPGPKGDPRELTLARWDGRKWLYSVVAKVDHNYDFHNMHVDSDGGLTIVGPTLPGPQPSWCGGEMAMWTSSDGGDTWKLRRQLTAASASNHTFARIPLEPDSGFFAFWADGDPSKPSDSRLYFATREGKVFRMPQRMAQDFAEPEVLE